MTEPGRRLLSIGLLVVALFTALLVRVSLLGTVQSASLRREAERSLRDINPLPATRGRILSRDGQVLVDNLAVNVVKLDAQKIPKLERTAVLGRLSQLLDVPFSTIESRLVDPRNPRYEPARIATKAKESAIVYIVENPDLFPTAAVSVDVTWQRVYPFGRLAAHVLGYLGPVNADDIRSQPADLRYQNADSIGRAGIEKSFERELRGVPGEEVVTKDPSGRVVDRKRVREPVPGSDVRLAIDIGLQDLAESTLAQGLRAARENQFVRGSKIESIKAEAGALVCMDVTTGEVVASASYPAYDPAEFTDGLSLKRDAEYRAPESHAPLINRVIEGRYPPGSTFKIFTAIAALRYGLITTSTSYEDKGVFEVPSLKGKAKWQWKNAGSPPSQFGVIDLEKALRVSADTFFYKIGFDFHMGRTNENGIQQVARELGLGSYTNIRLPNESRGIIPDRARQKRLHDRFPDKFAKDWPLGATINASIGQGDVLVTPLQLARSYAALANGGTVLDTKIELEVIDRATADRLMKQAESDALASPPTTTTTLPVAPTIPEGPLVSVIPKSEFGVDIPSPVTLPPVVVKPDVEGHVELPDEFRSVLLRGLEGAVGGDRGTAVGAFEGFDLNRFGIAGKTGTAEKPPQQDYAVFVGFGPLPEPKFSCAAIIEQGGFGRQAGALVRRMFEGIAGFRIQPVRVVSQGGSEN